ncbi:acetyl-CoA synthetase-like protein [Xylariaceae sp. AK1471]|nr:acetyl-CoA synthetase-like protein [Xylariaceae sp. AK1471]
MRGACVCMPTEEERMEGTESFVNRTGANWAFFTPSVARTLDPSRMPELKTVVLGGEGTSKDIVSRWWRGRRLINSYGPCESSIWFSFAEVVNEDVDVRNVGIPHPTYNRGHVVDPTNPNVLMPEQGSAMGELLIEGYNVVRGYLNDDGRSAAAFIEPPVWSRKPEDSGQDAPRFYLTGDLVERCEDGSFRILGRKDRQVKIRGQKVDLNEIRHHFLSKTTTIHDFVPLFEGFSITQQQRRHELVAFVVPRSQLDFVSEEIVAEMTEELRADLKTAYEALRHTIPAFLIPTLFVPLARIPLNAHSKADTIKLSSILSSLSKAEERLFGIYQRAFRPLQGENEVILGQAMSQELGLEATEINANDGFLQFGGDSIKAMSIVTFLYHRGKRLSVKDIMTSETLADVARLITAIDPLTLEQVIPAPFSLLKPGTSVAIRSQAAQACGVTEEAVHDVFPCTALQEGLIGVSLRDPRANIAKYVFKLGSTINEDLLTVAWQQTFSTIQTLRTRFFMSASLGLLQVVVNGPAVVNKYKGSSSLPVMENDGPFDPGRPMVQTTIATLRNGDSEQRYLIMKMHHAIIDLFTLRLIMKTFQAVYQGLPLPPLVPFQVTIAERRDTTAMCHEFWKSALKHSQAPIWPPSTSIASLTSETQWARCSRILDISQMSYRLGSHTLSTYIQAAWALLVGIYEASEDVSYGLVVSGRVSSRCDSSAIAGPMLATCPLRLHVDREMTIAQFLQTTQEKVVETSRYAHFGLQNISRLGHDEKRACSLQTLLVVQPDVDPTETPDMDMEFDRTLSQQESLGSYTCWVECTPRGSQLRIDVEYLPQVVGSGDLILKNLEHVLCALVDYHAEDTLLSLPPLPIEDPSKVSHPQHEASMDVLEETVHDYIFKIGRANPDKQAVVGWDGSFTYQQIDELSFTLALQLRRAGVDVGTFVPLCAHKSVWVVIGLLAILRAGGVYVPLDIQSPPSRHQEILSQFHSTVALVSPGDSRSWPDSVKYMIDLDSTFRMRHSCETANPESSVLTQEAQASLPVVSPDGVSFCFFTSGTTGAPKGVLIQHKAHLTSALARLNQFERHSGSRVLQVSAFAYDLSVEDICTTLYAGGTVIMPSEDERLNDLVGAINRYAVNNINVTPSFASLLRPEAVPTLEVLVVGGEVPSETLYSRWIPSRLHLINAYGPTECCNWSTVTRAVAEDTRNIGWMTCGRAWLTHPDDPHTCMPLGAVGELLLEGPMLAQGYLGNPHATSAAFVADLKWAQPGSRFYRTGDLVRSNQDGSFTFIRRRDHQVKVNGVRIELAEIEGKILSAGQGMLSDVCVEAIDVEGKRTLVAFCVSMATETSEQLSSHIVEKLRTLLPPPLIPALFVPLDTLPMSLTGKRDRRQLRHKVETATADQICKYRVTQHSSNAINRSSCDQIMPRNGLFQASLARAWIEVLELRSEVDLKPTSNFFALGGDSVMAMRLVAACRELNMHISVQDIYEWPTLCDLERVLDRASLASLPTTVSPPAPFSLLGSWKQHSKVLSAVHEQMPDADVEDVYPCTAFQEGIMALSVMQPGAYVAEHRFQMVSGSAHDASRLRRACVEVVKANPIFRTRLVNVDSLGLFQVVLSSSGSEIESLVLPEDHDNPVRPWEPCSPLAYFAVLEGDRPELVCYASHAVFDAFTWDLLCKQITSAYRSESQPLPLIPYSGFVAHLQRTNDGESERFWSKQLDGAEPETLFSKSHRRVEKSQFFDFDLDSHDDDRVSGEITDATRLHAAWALVVSRFTSSHDVVFGSVVSQRIQEIPKIDSIMGPCIATVPVRVQLNRDVSIREAVRTLQRQLIEVVPHAHLGMTKIGVANKAACEFDSLLTVFPPPAGSSASAGGVTPVLNKPAYDLESGYYTHSLVLEVQPSKSKLHVQAVYNSSLVSSFLVKCLLRCFVFAYEQLGMSKNQDITLADVDICSPSDKQTILSWNLACSPSSGSSTVPHLVAAQGRRTPHKTAIEAWDGTITYGELERYSSGLAHYIQRHFDEKLRGVEVIPICFSRSRWVPVVMLAIQKLGRAYTALDPGFPTQRLSQLVKQLQTSFVIADSEQGSRFDVEVLVVHQAFINNIPKTPAFSWESITAENPAIVLFTSGSTGAPKTILLQQKAVVSAITGFGPGMDFGPQTRTLQNAAFAFDIHACEVFLTLAHGGCLIVSDSDQSQLATQVRIHQVNWLFMTPSTMHLLSGPNEIPSIKTLMMIGEAPTKAIVKTWARPRDQLHLINAYGPAENTLFSTMQSISSPNDEATNIGKGVNTLAWIVDPSNVNILAPLGFIGELVLQGTQLAREYLHQPEETSKAFITAPDWAKNLEPNEFGERFYKTGDLVKYEHDGTLSIVGRTDSQTKLNGQRLELSEVEYHVSQLFPSSHLAAEIVEPHGGPRCLAVFIEEPQSIVPSPPSSTSSRTIFTAQDNEQDDSSQSRVIQSSLANTFESCRETLTDRLPSFMVPSLFITVNKLPQTASNKLDRKWLRKLVSGYTFEELDLASEQLPKGARDSGIKQPPQTPSEIAVQNLWAKVLGRRPGDLAAEDHFFRVGGDSIRAIRLATLLSAKRIGSSPITVAAVFENPRLRDMATLLDLDSSSPKLATIKDSVKPSSPRFDLIDIGQKAQDELINYCAADLGIPASSIQDIYPCTDTQEAMLAASALSPNAYVMEQKWDLMDSIDVDRLEYAWRLTIEKFEILRTAFVSTHTLGTLQVVTQLAKGLSVFCKEGAQSKNKRELSMLRIEPAQQGRVRLVWRAHHALFDQWTIMMVINAVEKTYRGVADQDISQFKIFIRHLAESSSKHSVQASDAYWKKYLQGVAPTPFPNKPSAPTIPSKGHGRVTLKTSLKAAHGVTAATIARAAWSLVLSKYTNVDTVVFGTTLSGRNAPLIHIENVCGPTITTVPVRVRIDERQSIGSFLKNLQDEAVAMMPHEHHGLQRIRQLSEETRDLCEFQSLLVIQPAWAADEEGMTVMKPIEDRSTTSHYHTLPLVVECSLDGENGMLEAHFDMSVISSVGMLRILHQIEQAAHQLQNRDPETAISGLELLSRWDRDQISKWNYDRAEIINNFIDVVISEQTARRPNAHAICAHDGNLTYAQLEDEAARVAALLTTVHGIGPGDIVPLCFEKSLWAMVAMLAVLKSGAAFVPTDPAQSIGRLNEIMHQIQPRVILVSEETDRFAFETCALHIVVNRRTCEGNKIINKVDNVARQARSPSDLAYIIFTSGSTGKPKGVMIQHNSYLTSARPRRYVLARDENARVIQFSTYSFDTSIEDTLTTWGYGACVCIPSEDERLNDLEGAMNRMQVSCAHLTPSLTAALEPANLPTLRQLHFGGEKMTGSALRRWTESGVVDARNVYGPTESSISTTITAKLTPDSDPSNTGFAVGCNVWIADALNHDRLVPVGCTGELLIEGHVLAKGYFKNPEKTAEAFIVNPKWSRTFGLARDAAEGSQRRFYKTGDVAKYADDGSIICLGRKDSQVKLNGNRIEIGDVETNLWRILGQKIDDLAVEVVVPKQNNPSLTPMLVAFIAIGSSVGTITSSETHEDDDDSNTAGVLNSAIARSALTTILQATNAVEKMRSVVPSYMVPTAFVPLRSIPQSIAKKTDRNAIQRLVSHFDTQELRSFVDHDISISGETDSGAPGLEIVRELCSVVLGQERKRIKTSHSFISLGGDSILALRFVAAARRRGFNDLTVVETLRARSLADLAVFYQAKLNAAGQDHRQTDKVSHDASETGLTEEISAQLQIPPREIEFIQLATGFEQEAFEASLLPERGYLNSFTFTFEGPVQMHKLEHACERLIARHGALRTVFVKHQGDLYHVTLRHCLPDSPRVQCFTEDELDSRLTIPEGKTGKPLVKFSVITRGQKTDVVLCMSHALYDGMSFSIFCRDLSQAYRGLPLDAPVPQFNDFITELSSTTSRIESHKMWTTLLQGSMMTELRAENALANNIATEVRSIEDSEVSTKFHLPRSGRPSGFTFASLLKAAWALVLERKSGTDDVVFGHVVSTRPLIRSSIDGLVGPCLEFVPVRVKVAKEPRTNDSVAARDLLEQVQNQYIEGMPHYGFGFPSIVRECTQWPISTRMPTFVQHRSLDESPAELVLGENMVARAQTQARTFGLCDLWVVTTALDGDEIDVTLSYSSRVFQDDRVRMLMHALVAELFRLVFLLGELE